MATERPPERPDVGGLLTIINGFIDCGEVPNRRVMEDLANACGDACRYILHLETQATPPPTETDEQARERRICDFEKFATQLEGETFDEALAAAFYLAGMEAEAAHQKEKTDD